MVIIRIPTILVTGVGAIIGQGIIKSLRIAKKPVKIIGLDQNPEAIGRYWCDTFYAKPCDEECIEYDEFILNLIKKENIDLVLPGIEEDIYYFDAHRYIFSQNSIHLGLNHHELIEISNDKWLTGLKLQEHGLPVIPSQIEVDWDKCISSLGEPPFLMKPRHGSGSRGIVKVFDSQDLLYWKHKVGEEFLIQKIVGSDDEEYTVGTFGFGDGNSTNPIIFKRRLSSAGSTQNAEVVYDEDILKIVTELNKLFLPLGSTNYQFRKENDEVFLLEINPRISSSTSLRAAFGYNEAWMNIEFFLYNRRPLSPIIRSGKAFRYTEDYIIHDSNNF